MSSRRQFIRNGSLGLGSLFIATKSWANTFHISSAKNAPLVISTWKHGIPANAEAWKILSTGGRSIDAVEAGVKVVENDFNNRSVGLGGTPDRDGFTTLDACIMDEHGNCGAVAFLQHIQNPISVARKVMDATPHVMLVGDGAYQFAIEQGFKKVTMDIPEVKKAWEEWRKKSNYQPVINIENHDTIGMLAMDAAGNISGSCTTSGLGYKMHGRVGDSPIIGAGLFVDNEVGGACATGLGEYMVRVCGSHTVVELMRQGHHPEKACKLAVERIVKKYKNLKDVQVGFLALSKSGEYGGYSLQKGFDYAVQSAKRNALVPAAYSLTPPKK